MRSKTCLSKKHFKDCITWIDSKKCIKACDLHKIDKDFFCEIECIEGEKNKCEKQCMFCR